MKYWFPVVAAAAVVVGACGCGPLMRPMTIRPAEDQARQAERQARIEAATQPAK